MKQPINPRPSHSRIVAVKGSKTIPPDELPHAKISRGGDFWRWGDNNMLPAELALMSRRSTTHRRIINDKADYISGNDFTHDPDGHSGAVLAHLAAKANNNGETLRQVFNKIAFDKVLFGNAFLEIVADEAGSFMALYHHDASLCRVARDERHIALCHDWARYRPGEAKKLPLFPGFGDAGDGLRRSMIHYKDYEPMFVHYGVPSYIAGMNVSSIAYKTDRWNMSRLDNSFQLSGVMMLDGSADDPEQAEQIMNTAEKKFSGQPGQVMFMLKENDGDDTSRFIPISSGNEGDWRELHDQATGDIVVAHSWFRSLSGLDYGGGFSAERIMHEYELALNTVILPEQAELLEPIRRAIEHVMKIDASTLDVVNKPPKSGKSLYMKVWEARRDDGLEYDPADPEQQQLLARITKYNLRSID